ncbi:uncharacterized protein [Miscanthus floridulus]|uniref:uncharacterized protein n=1 Tax=Miscanthus floridulus TaxID=154761 RepID=UPI003458D1E2
MAATLVEELVEEILIRIPPKEPAHLVRAALVCKAWCRILTDAGFLRRYRRFHGTPPLLGYIQNLHNRVCFFPTSTASPVSAAALTLKTMLDLSSYLAALDCRHGRVLIHIPHNRDQLIVWDPITGSRQHLSLAPYIHSQSCTGSVLCATKACDHLDCGGGPFFVVFVWTWMNDAVDGMNIQASIYWSETSAWSTPTSIDTNCYIHMTPGLLIGDVLHFTINIHEGLSILKYDLCKHGLSVIDVPRGAWIPLVMKGEHRELLQLATLLDNCIYMWSQQDVTNGIHGWVKNKVMDLTPLLPELGYHTRTRKVIGFAEGTEIIFISTYAGIITLNLKSRQVRKVCDRKTYTMFPVLPYMSFCTPR